MKNCTLLIRRPSYSIYPPCKAREHYSRLISVNRNPSSSPLHSTNLPCGFRKSVLKACILHCISLHSLHTLSPIQTYGDRIVCGYGYIERLRGHCQVTFDVTL